MHKHSGLPDNVSHRSKQDSSIVISWNSQCGSLGGDFGTRISFSVVRTADSCDATSRGPCTVMWIHCDDEFYNIVFGVLSVPDVPDIKHDRAFWRGEFLLLALVGHTWPLSIEYMKTARGRHEPWVLNMFLVLGLSAACSVVVVLYTVDQGFESSRIGSVLTQFFNRKCCEPTLREDCVRCL